MGHCSMPEEATAPSDPTCSPVQVVKVGRTVATITADIRMAHSRRLVAQGRHTKFLPSNEFEVKGLPLAKL